MNDTHMPKCIRADTHTADLLCTGTQSQPVPNSLYWIQPDPPPPSPWWNNSRQYYKNKHTHHGHINTVKTASHYSLSASFPFEYVKNNLLYANRFLWTCKCVIHCTCKCCWQSLQGSQGSSGTKAYSELKPWLCWYFPLPSVSIHSSSA